MDIEINKPPEKVRYWDKKEEFLSPPFTPQANKRGHFLMKTHEEEMEDKTIESGDIIKLPFTDKTAEEIKEDLVRLPCTGGKDKRGVEIYLGDILNCYKRGQDKHDERRLCTVEWNDKRASFELITRAFPAQGIATPREYGWSSSAVDFHTLTTMVDKFVVGNVFKDQHLLEEAEDGIERPDPGAPGRRDIPIKYK